VVALQSLSGPSVNLFATRVGHGSSTMPDGLKVIPAARLACSCPLCGAALAFAPVKRGVATDDNTRQAIARALVREHLTSAHASMLQYSTALAVGAVVASAATENHLVI
jgi:hypothetical protein